MKRILLLAVFLTGCPEGNRVYVQCLRDHVETEVTMRYDDTLKVTVPMTETYVVCDESEVRVRFNGRTYELGDEIK